MTTGKQRSDLAHRRPGTPWRFTWPDWKAVLSSSWDKISSDNIDLMSAGVAFYAFLALVPLLGAIVLTYGLLATPDSVTENVRVMTKAIPADAARLIGQELLNIVATSSSKKGLGLALALLLALYGVRSSAGATITALNVAYEEEETRGFFRFNGIVLMVTITAVVFALGGVAAAAVLARLEALVPGMAPALRETDKVGSYLAIMVVGGLVAGALYRIAPCRPFSGWIWVTPGAMLTGAGWLVVMVGFGSYVASIGHYNVTYGSLGAVIVMLTWFYLSSFILLVGAEINAACERQMDMRQPDQLAVAA